MEQTDTLITYEQTDRQTDRQMDKPVDPPGVSVSVPVAQFPPARV